MRDLRVISFCFPVHHLFLPILLFNFFFAYLFICFFFCIVFFGHRFSLPQLSETKFTEIFLLGNQILFHPDSTSFDYTTVILFFPT